MLFHLANQFGHLQASLSFHFTLQLPCMGCSIGPSCRSIDTKLIGRNFRVNLGVDLRGQKWCYGVCFTLPETNSLHLKIDPWKFGDSYWKPPFLGAMLVLGRVFIFSFWTHVSLRL